jgi:hypothetical protein
MSARRDLALAGKAKRHGANYSLRIVREARRAGIPVSLGFALIEQESGFRNVFGHDPTVFVGAGKVTRKKYLQYKLARDANAPRRRLMQGVGPAQLTWFEFQDAADRMGGCWKPACNIRYAFQHLAVLIESKGETGGIAAFNGSGPAAQRYAVQVRARQHKWHNRLA